MDLRLKRFSAGNKCAGNSADKENKTRWKRHGKSAVLL